MRRARSLSFLLLAGLALGACTSGATPAPSAAPPSVAASVAPSLQPSVPSTAPSATPSSCGPTRFTLTTAGKLTIGTDNPAYPPYYDIPAAGATKPWELG